MTFAGGVYHPVPVTWPPGAGLADDVNRYWVMNVAVKVVSCHNIGNDRGLLVLLSFHRWKV